MKSGHVILEDEAFRAVLVPAGVATALVLVLLAAWVFVRPQRDVPAPRGGWFGRLIHFAFFVSVVVLAATSFGSILRFGHMRGYPLMAHTAGAGAFVFLLLAVAASGLPLFSGRTFSETQHEWWLTTASRWLLILSGLVVSGTMFASMVPILGTEELLEAVRLHRYAGLVTTVAACVYLLGRVCRRFGRR